MRSFLSIFVLLFLFALAVSPAQAGGHVAAIRLSSIDAALADAERVSAMSDENVSREELFQNALGSVGLSDGSWIDTTRSLVASLPAEGLMNFGWVMALPVTSTETALSSLEAALGSPESVDGLYAFSSPFGTTMHLRPIANYVIVGQAAAAVRSAELGEILDVGDLPPGNIALDVDLVPLTAMIQLGMAAGRQGVLENLDLDESDTAGREAAVAIFDLYVGMVNDTLLNAKRLQLSLEYGSDYITLYKRLLPRGGSTLAGLLAAQKDGFPEIARRVHVDSAVATMVSGIELTDAVRAAFKEYSTSYTRFTESYGESMGDAESEWLSALTGPWTKLADKWLACLRGDTVASYTFSAEGGFGVTQLAGVTDAEGCVDLVTDVGKAIDEIPTLPDGRDLSTVNEQALTHAGVSATRVEIDMLGEELSADAEALEFFEQMFGGESYVYYLGMKKDLLISTAGAGAEPAFKAVVDRLSSKKKRGGMTPDYFKPLEAGSGFFVALDATRILEEIAKLDPEDEELQELGAVAEKAGRWVFGMRLQPDSMTLEFAMPVTAIEAIDELDDDDDHENEYEGDDDQDMHHEAEAEEHG